MVLKGKVYDVLKWISLIVFPAVNALYLGLAQAWEWDNSEATATTILLINAFLGAILQVSSSSFKNHPPASAIGGYLSQNGSDPDTGIPNLQLTVTKHPDELLEGNTVLLKVGAPPPRTDVPPPDSDVAA